ILGLLYNPASADVSVDFFICPKKDVIGLDPSDPSHKRTFVKYGAGKLYQIGGTDAHITGHHVTRAIGVNPYANQVALDFATVDLANQLDCIIYQELAELQIKDYAKKQRAIYGDNDLGQTAWCINYYRALKAFEGKYPMPVSRPPTFQ
ncbi:MAG: hypothetical protein JO092_00915, partial [Candidatus Eremiobacteraeota bacterium]|nr:hypothetical protein [Candidatus Eremiobacteraeota bacterium]